MLAFMLMVCHNAAKELNTKATLVYAAVATNTGAHTSSAITSSSSSSSSISISASELTSIILALPHLRSLTPRALARAECSAHRARNLWRKNVVCGGSGGLLPCARRSGGAVAGGPETLRGVGVTGIRA